MNSSKRYRSKDKVRLVQANKIAISFSLKKIE